MRFVSILIALAGPALAVPPPAPLAATGPAAPGYADLADLATRSNVAVAVEIRRATRLKGPDAAGIAVGQARFYVEARVEALLRGQDGLPADVAYLVDLPLDSRGRAPKLKAMHVLLLANRVPGRAGELQLSGPAAQLDRTPATEARLRAILTELVAPDAPAAITGIANAFYVPGSLPGESETQIFLTTANAKPISLSILRRPGEAVRWAVSLGDIVDETAAAPAPNSLLWYRLACGLPQTLPETATTALSPQDATAARADYAVVLAGLGPCGRRGG